MDAEAAGPPPPPSPLTGCYLLVVVAEPHSKPDQDIILQRIAKGLLSWDAENCHVDLEKELQAITNVAPEGEEARHGERLIQFASENLVTEVLIHPAANTLIQCMKNLLSSFTRHRHIIHAGYTFGGNGSWALQDGTFSLADFSEAFQENEVQRVIRAYENTITIDIHCSAEGDWARLPKEPFTRMCKVQVNPNDVLTSGSPAINNFLNYLSAYLVPSDIDTLLESSDVVGNIRFSHPTLYVFPGGQGDAALFGINGFNMLVDGGFARKACFWDFTRHLDRLDAVLLTRLNNSNVCGVSSVLRRKTSAQVYPQIGHFFCNLQERKAISPDGDKDKDPLLINLMEEGHNIILNLRQLNLRPQPCYRDAEPINLYHKVGHGTLDMYVLSPAKDSKEVKEFLQKWNSNDQKLFATKPKDFSFPLPNLVSICALLVWQPANPSDTITRLLFPGSTPQHKIFEGLDRLKHLEFMKHPVCTAKTLTPSGSILGLSKSKQIKATTVLDKILPNEQKSQRILDNKPVKERFPPGENKRENKITENKKIEVNGTSEINKVIKSDSVESDKSEPKSEPKKTEVNGKDVEIILEDKSDTKTKPKSEPKKQRTPPKTRSESATRRADKKPKIDKKPETKPSPPTPKKTEPKVNGVSKDKPRLVSKNTAKSSPSATPAKSTKDANNRKVVESKYKPAPKKEPKEAPKPDKKEPAKVERKPISRRPKAVSPARGKVPASPSKKPGIKTDKNGVSRAIKLDKEGTTDSSAVSTPSADQDTKKIDVSKLTKTELEELKAKELADLKEEQEVVKEIEAVFRKDEKSKEVEQPDLRKIKDVSLEDKTTEAEEEEEEYLIVEKEEVEQNTDSVNEQESANKEDEQQKHQRDSEESEKPRKGSDADKKPEEEIPVEEPKLIEAETCKVLEIVPPAKEDEEIAPIPEMIRSKEDSRDKTEEMSKEISMTSPEDKIDVSSEKKLTGTGDVEEEKEAVDQHYVLESQPDEKFSATVESGATTAPTLPEDERIPLDEIKEDQVIEEKYVKEETKEKEIPTVVVTQKTIEPVAKISPIIGMKFDAHQSHIRDIVKTPDEVADLPVHEEVDIDTYDFPGTFKKDDKKVEKREAPTEDAKKSEGFFSSIKDAVKETISDVKDMVKGKMDDAKDKVQDETKAKEEVLHEKIEEAKQIEQDMKHDIESAQDKMNEAKDKIEGIKEDLKEAESKFEEKIDSSKELIEEKIGDTIDKAAAVVEESKDLLEDKVEEAKDEAAAIKEDIKDKLETAVHEAKEAVVEQVEEAKEQIGATKDKVQDVKEEIASKIEESTEAATEFIEESKKVLQESVSDIKDIKEIVKDKVDETANLIDDKVDDLKDTIADLKETAEEKIGDTKEEAADVVQDTIEDIKKKVDDIKDKTKDQIEEATTVAKETKDMANDKIEDLKEKVDEIKDEAKEKIEHLKKEATTVAEETKEAVADKIEDVKETIEEQKDKTIELIQDIKEAGQDKLEDVKEKIDEAKYKTEELKEDISAKIEDIKDKVSTAAEESKESVQEKLKDVQENVQGKIDESKDKISAFIEESTDVVADKIEEAKEKIEDTKEKAATIVEDTKEIVQEKVVNLKDKIDDTKDNASEVIKDSKEIIEDKIENSKDKISEAKDLAAQEVKDVKEQIEDSTEIIQEKIEDVKEKISDVKDAFEDKVSDIKDKIDDTKDKVDETKDAIKEKIDEAKDTISDIKNGISDKFDNLKDTLISNKEEVTEDIKDKVDEVKEKIEEKKEDIKEAVEEKEDDLKAVKEDILQKATAFTDLAHEKVDDLKDKLTEDKDTIESEIIDTIVATKEAADDKVKDTKEEIGDLLDDKTEDLKSAVKSVTDKVEANRDSVEEIRSSITEDIKSAIGDVKEKADEATEKVEDTIETVKDTSKEKADDLKVQISNLAEKTRKLDNQIDTAVEEIEMWKQDIKNNLDESVSTIKDSIKDKLEDLSETTEKDTSAVISDAKDIISDIIKQAEDKTSEKDDLADKEKEDIEDDYYPLDPKERETEVLRIVSNVAHVLKSDAPLEELTSTLPLVGSPFKSFPLKGITTELRETHITTLDSPVKEDTIITTEPPKDQSPQEKKISDLIKDSNALIASTSKIISEIKSKDDKSPDDQSSDDDPNLKKDPGVVHRMLVTASSEDGGEETVICPVGSIKFNRAETSSPDPLSGRSTPEQDLQESSEDTKKPVSGKSTPEDLKQENKGSKSTPEPEVQSGKATPDVADKLSSGKSTPDIKDVKVHSESGKATPDIQVTDSRKESLDIKDDKLPLSGKSTPDIKEDKSGKATPEVQDSRKSSIMSDLPTSKRDSRFEDDIIQELQKQDIKIDLKDAKSDDKISPDTKDEVSETSTREDVDTVKEISPVLADKTIPDIKEDKKDETQGKKEENYSGKASPAPEEVKSVSPILSTEKPTSGKSTPDIKDEPKMDKPEEKIDLEKEVKSESPTDLKELESCPLVTDTKPTEDSTESKDKPAQPEKLSPELKEEIKEDKDGPPEKEDKEGSPLLKKSEDLSGKSTPISKLKEEEDKMSSGKVSGTPSPTPSKDLQSGKATPDLRSDISDRKLSEIRNEATDFSGISTPELKYELDDVVMSGKSTPNLQAELANLKSSESGKSTPEPTGDICRMKTPDIKNGSGISTPDLKHELDEVKSGKSTPALPQEVQDLKMTESGKSSPVVAPESGKSTPALPAEIKAEDSGKSSPALEMKESEKSTPAPPGELSDLRDSGKSSPIPEVRIEEVESGKSTPASKHLDSGKTSPDFVLESGKSTPALPSEVADLKATDSGKSSPAPPEIKDSKSVESGKSTPAPEFVDLKATDSGKSSPFPSEIKEVKPVDSGKSTPALIEIVDSKPSESAKSSPSPDNKEVKVVESGKSTPVLPAEVADLKATDSGKSSPAPERKIVELVESGKSTPAPTADLKAADSGKSSPAPTEIKEIKPVESGKSTPALPEVADIKTLGSGKSSPAPANKEILVESGKSTPALPADVTDLKAADSGKSSPTTDIKESGKSTPVPAGLKSDSGKSSPEIKDVKTADSGKSTPAPVEVADLKATDSGLPAEVKDLKTFDSGKSTPVLPSEVKDQKGLDSGKSTPVLPSDVKDLKYFDSGKSTPEEIKQESGKATPDISLGIKEDAATKLTDQKPEDLKANLKEDETIVKDMVNGKLSPEIPADKSATSSSESLETKADPIPSLAKEVEKIEQKMSIIQSFKEELTGKSSPLPEIKTIITELKEEVKSGKSTPDILETKSGKSTPDIKTEKTEKSDLVTSETTAKTETKPSIPDIKESAVEGKEQKTTEIIVTKDEQSSLPPVITTEVTDLSIAGPSHIQRDDSIPSSGQISPLNKEIQHLSSEDLHLSGKSTPDIADVERMKEIHEILKHEKHIPGSSTPPTVPVSPIVKETFTLQVEKKETKEVIKDAPQEKAAEKKSTKEEKDIRCPTPGSDDYELGGVSSPHSDISSGQMSRVAHAWGHGSSEERQVSDDEDVPGSPTSVTSQMAHSPPYVETDYLKMGKMDPMNTSFYGALPDEPIEEASGKTQPIPISGKTHYEFEEKRFLDEADLDFEKAMQEHRQARGSDLVGDSLSYKFEITTAKVSKVVKEGTVENGKDQIAMKEIKKNGFDDHQASAVPSKVDSPKKTSPEMMTSSFIEPSSSASPKKDPIESWGKPLGLPSPALPPSDMSNKTTPKKIPPSATLAAKNKINDERKRSDSPSKYDKKNKKIAPVYMDLTYVPHHGNSNYSYVEFFKRIRARYYVFSGTEPSREVFNALLEAKQTWEDKDLEVTIIPTYDTDVLGYWVAENEDLLAKHKIDLSPSASRCTINLQDHETSCSAYRLEF